MTNAEKPDLVLLTGDFVCHSQLYLDQLTEVMRGVPGAGDRRARQSRPLVGRGRGPPRPRARRRRGAVQPPHDDHAAPRAPAGRRPRRRVHRARAPRRRGEGAARAIYRPSRLSHIAEEADGLWRHGVPLVLSGHTHARAGHARAAARVRGRQDRRTQVRARPLRIAPPRAARVGTTSPRARSTSAPASAPRWCRSASAIAASARWRCSSSAASRVTSSSTTPSRSR